MSSSKHFFTLDPGEPFGIFRHRFEVLANSFNRLYRPSKKSSIHGPQFDKSRKIRATRLNPLKRNLRILLFIDYEIKMWEKIRSTIKMRFPSESMP